MKDKEDRDFKIVGTESDGSLIFEGIPSGERYVSGETLEEFGVDNLRESDILSLVRKL